MSRKSAIIALVVVFVFAAGNAFAYPNAVKGAITIDQTSPEAIAVSTDDRWVFTAATGGVISAIDTLQWPTLSGIIPIVSMTSGNPVEMAVSPDGKYLFVTGSDGYLTRVDLTSLATYTFGDAVSLTTSRCLLDADGAALGSIAIGPIPGELETSSLQYIVVSAPNAGLAPSIKVMAQAAFAAGTCVATTILTGGKNPAGIAAARNPADTLNPYDYIGHILLDSFAANTDAYANFDFGTSSYTASPNFVGDFTLGDIAVNSTGDKVFFSLGDGVNEYIGTVTWSTTWGAPNLSALTPFASDRDVSLTVSKVDTTDEMLFFAANDTVSGDADLDIYSMTPTLVGSIAFTGAALSDLDASSSADGYLYAASTVGVLGKVQVITDNPWLTALGFDQPYNNGSINTTGTVTTDSAGTLYVYRGGTIKRTGGVLIDTVVVSAPGTVTFTITPSDLIEGDNDILVFLVDASGNTGRIGGLFAKDSTPPSTVNFTVGFGDSTLYVNIETLCDASVDEYVIYYDTTEGDLYFDPPDSPSISLTSFTSCSDAQVTIPGLTNGTVYYVVVRAVDSSGTEGPLSSPQWAMPQATFGYVAKKGGSGGCAASTNSPSPLGAAFVIIVAALLVVVSRKSIANRSNRA